MTDVLTGQEEVPIPRRGAQGSTTTGAIAALAGNISVKVSGAVGNGVADDTAAIQSAIDAAHSQGGGIVFFPAGDYKAGPLDLTGKSNIKLLGSGAKSSQILTTVANHDTLLLNDSTYIAIEALGFSSTATHTAPCAAIHIEPGCSDIFIDNVWIGSAYHGIWVDGASVLIWGDEIEIDFPVVTNGTGVLIAGGNDHYFNRTFVNGNPASQPSAAFTILASGGSWINGCGGLSTGIGLRLAPSTGQVVEHLFLMNNAWDSGSAYGISFEAVSTGIVRRVQSTGDWTASMAGEGVVFSGTAKEINFVGLRCINNVGIGFLINTTTAVGVRLRDSLVSGNATGSPNPGVYVAAGVTDFSIQNNKIGLAADLQNTQNYGVYVAAGASDNYQIAGNNLIGNTTAGLLDGGTGTNKTVADNLGSILNVRPVPSVDAVNDAAAATAGVPVGGTYRNGSVLMTRVS